MSKIQYELYIRTWSHLNPNAREDQDYETIDFDPCLNYRDAVKRAKELSKNVPFKDHFGNEIVQIQVAAYIHDEEEKYGTTYYLVWKETYENGKGLGRYSYSI